MTITPGPPKLACPTCGAGLIPATGCGQYTDGEYLEHRYACPCPWCEWTWLDDGEPVTCGCGARAEVVIDGDAYARLAGGNT